jgi:hypothetical protein
MPSAPKSKAERVKEAVEILTQLKEVGVPDTDSSYKMTKMYLDAWIDDGEPRLEKIYFPKMMRTGHMLLPRLAGRPASFALKVTDELREYLKQNPGAAQ